DDSVQALGKLLPDGLVVAAFDLVDHGKGLPGSLDVPIDLISLVIKYTTSWGRSFFEVIEFEENRKVSIDLPSPTVCYCSCPAFAFNVLMSDKQATCKHVLAVQIARKLNMCIERAITQDELVAVLCD
ncbi:hypothetical protein BU17DRAFT_53574, partial [Hysterangium stoloniferum]